MRKSNRSSSASASSLAPELRSLVKQSVALLGQIIAAELGDVAYRRIEKTRQRMRALRSARSSAVVGVLRDTFKELERMSPQQRRNFAKSYTLMLELMNSCENAYRSARLREKPEEEVSRGPDSIIYVLTAHPTEARAPANISAFHEVQKILLEVLLESRGRSRVRLKDSQRDQLRHWLEIAWRVPVVRSRKPRVSDEAEHIYSTLLREETLETLLLFSRDVSPVLIRSWVGGDKDGHPGVDEKAFQESLALSRASLLRFARGRLRRVAGTLNDLPGSELRLPLRAAENALAALGELRAGDGKRVLIFRQKLRTLIEAYLAQVQGLHPALADLLYLVRMFPGLVVPLEFREASDVIEGGGKNLAIARMLRRLRDLSRGAEPRWYCRGLVVSMTERVDHVLAAARLIQRELGEVRIPVVPLFEQTEALVASPGIVRAMIRNPLLRKARLAHWENYLEVMVGYSDSAKEAGVLPSRRTIAGTLEKLDRICRREKVIPLFFHGSGGSVDRGGGSIQEQTAWWPESSLRNYKVTIQGEMVERSLASPEIARGQLQRIAQVSALPHQKRRVFPAVDALADRVSAIYRETVADPAFLRVVEQATPYRFLTALKIGSRPAKRTKQLSVSGLRAIPWVLCWTQTRVLFPTWWGVGTAWKEMDAKAQRELVRAYGEDSLFSTYVRSLAFTLAKVELSVFRIYLESGGLSASEVDEVHARFEKEFRLTMRFVQSVMQSRKILGWRPWLQESIQLRSPMIHPLNLLQRLALRDEDFELLRLTVTGVASGMMTTG